MNFLKNLIGGESKNGYNDRIPDRLTPEMFGVYESFSHGFLHQASCLAYDCVQFLLAIGSHRGTIAIVGKPALEKHFVQPGNVPILQLVFVENRGYLISRCNDNSIYLWNIKDKLPFIEHKLEFQKEVPSVMSLSFQSNWLYVGMEGGNVHMVDVKEFVVSGYTIYWDKVTIHDTRQRNRPGDVVGVMECPIDPSKLLLAFSEGMCALWNCKGRCVEKHFQLSSKKTAVLMDIDWNSSGKHFAVSYSDGSIAIYNVKSEGRPEKVFQPHGTIAANSPIIQLQWVNNEGVEPIFVFSGGFPSETSGMGVKYLTLHNSKTTNLLNFENTVIDFICLPSTPYTTDSQRLFAAVVLTETELIVHDLQAQGFPAFNVPLSFDINYSPVTSIGYYGNCPDDFVAELQSVITKLPQQLNKSAKRWPLTGGKWGQEIPDPWTDLVVTGHANGTVRMWFCKSVIMQPLLTIQLSQYLKQFVKEPSDQGSPPIHMKRQQSTPESLHLTTPITLADSSVELRTTPTQQVVVTQHDSATPPSNDIASPTNRLRKISSGTSEEGEGGAEPLTPTTPRAKKKTKLFSGMKRLKKVSSKPIIEEVPSQPDVGGADMPPPSDSPKRPDQLGVAQTTPTRVSSDPCLSSRSPTGRMYTPTDHTPSDHTPGEGYMVLSLVNSPQGEVGVTGGCGVQWVGLDPHSQTLCVGTVGGHALCMDFSLKPTKRPPQSIDINFSEDSVIKPDEIESMGVVKPRHAPSVPYSFDYLFTNDIDTTLPGFHVLQHCFCYHGDQGEATGVHISTLNYTPNKNILVIGSDVGLCIVDTRTSTCLKILSHLESLLYVADPSNYSRQCRKLVEERYQQSNEGGPSPVRRNKSHASQLVSPLLLAEDLYDPTLKTIADNDLQCEDQLVTVVDIVQMFVNKSGEMSLTMWVGTKSGKVGVYIISKPKGQTKTNFLPTGIVLDVKSVVLNLLFLSEWGERLIKPYTNKEDTSRSSPGAAAVSKRRTVSSKGAVETEKPVNYAVVIAKDKIKCIGFPSNHNIAESKLSVGGAVGGDFLTCDGLPCVVTWSTSGCILIHTLPGLKPMIQTSHAPLLDYRSLHSFCVSHDGRGLYLATPTQVQRLSLTKSNQLNYPTCLPDLYVERDNPQPESKGILSTLFKQGSVINREELFGVEAAGKAWRSVAKRDESLSNKRQGGATGGASNAFTEAREKLDQRGKDLSQLEERTEQLQNDAADFSNVAHLLAEKYKKKRF